MDKKQRMRSMQSMSRSTRRASAAAERASAGEDVIQYTWSERFFGGAYFRFLVLIRWLALACFTGLLIGGGILAFNIRPPEGVDRLFPSHHVLSRFLSAIDSNTGPYHSSRDVATADVDLVLGMQAPFLDQSGTNRWDPQDRGTAVFEAGAMQDLISTPAGRR